jgi:2-dehydropantoate 2-reductase
MRVAIIGAGALGTLLAGILSDAKTAEVWLVGSTSSIDHLEAIRVHGLALNFAPGISAASVRNLGAFPHVTQTAALLFPCDLVIIAVKSYRTAEAAQQTQACLAPDGIVLTLQNGLGNREILESILKRRVVQGTTLLAANLTTPGQINVAALGMTALGSAVPPLDWLQQTLSVAAPVTVAEDVDGMIWAKLIINCAINPLTGLLDVPNGALLNSSEAAPIIAGVVDEIVALAGLEQITLPYARDSAIESVYHAARVTAANISSMLSDLRRGRSTEIDALNGAIVTRAAHFNLPTPINQTLTGLIKLRQRRA